MHTIRTQVAIVGAGPAGLVLSHLLAKEGIDSIVIDSRTRAEIESTIRAGVLEDATVQLLHRTGAAPDILQEAGRHAGMEFRFDDVVHRFDFEELTGRCVWLYPQHLVLTALIATRLAEGQDLRFGTSAVSVDTSDASAPRVRTIDTGGAEVEIIADFVVGADGSRSMVRETVTGSMTGGHFREYPFAWFGVLAEAPPSAEEPVYSSTSDGFALLSHRSPTVQRLYFQCDPETDPTTLTESEIWDALELRLPGIELTRGAIFQRDVLRFRSFVAHQLLRGRAALIGDAAHTVPPTGAKGLNLAVYDAALLAPALIDLLQRGDERRLESFEETALARIWKVQHFSWWMTSLLHQRPESTEFDRQRQLGELHMVTGSSEGQRYLADAYTGWPHAA